MKKIGLLVLALVLALGALGAGYAMWDKSLFVDGTVYTGEVDAEFVRAFTDDDGKPDEALIDPKDTGGPGAAAYDRWGALSSEDPKECKKIPLRYDKDVAMSTAGINKLNPQIASVTIDNAYPSYTTCAYFEIHNSGTIPVKIQAVYEHCSVDHSVSWDGGLTWHFFKASQWYKWPTGTVPCTVKDVDFDGDGKPELNIHITGIKIGQQLDKSQTALIDIDIHVKQAAVELTRYTFDEKVHLVQWNEYTP